MEMSVFAGKEDMVFTDFVSIMSMRFKHSIQREGFSIVPLNKLEKANITFSIMGDMELKEINNQMHGKDITI